MYRPNYPLRSYVALHHRARSKPSSGFARALLVLLAFVASLLATSPSRAQLTVPPTTSSKLFLAPQDGIEDEYLVVLANSDSLDEPEIQAAAEDLLARYDGSLRNLWHLSAPALLAEMNEDQARALAGDPAVQAVEQNRRFELVGSPPPGCYGASQTSTAAGEAAGTQAISCAELDPRSPGYACFDNWGLDRIDQSLLPRDGFFDYSVSGHGAHIYLLDSGIATAHPEFAGRIGPGINATVPDEHPDRSDIEDCFGHGTHVAGIAAGSTFGVAKDSTLHMVKIVSPCDPTEGGVTSYIIEGINWILSVHGSPGHEGPAVVSLSANNKNWGPVLAVAAQSLLDGGISFIQSAGNQNDVRAGQPVDACSMTLAGQVPEMLIAGGMDINTVGGQQRGGRWLREGPRTTGGSADPSYLASCINSQSQDCGSNTGPCIDIWAPAAHILSADHNGPDSSCRLSGTSMAAPHVAGAVALYLEENPTATPSQVHQAIIDRATFGILDADPASPYSIGDSPNRLLNINPSANRPPVGNPDLFAVANGSTHLSIFLDDMLANDTDPDGDELHICSYDDSMMEHGILETHFQGVRYLPDSSFWSAGQDRFRYLLSDSSDCLQLIPVDVFLEAVEPPVARDDFFVVPLETSSFLTAFNVLFANDSPAGGIRYSAHTQPQHGDVYPHLSGLVFQPTESFWTTGSTIFTYTVELVEFPALTATATVTLIADPVVFRDNFESGDLSSWDDQTTRGSASVQATGAAAKSGSFGFEVSTPTAASEGYVEKRFTTKEDSLYVSFWLNADALPMGSGERMKILKGRDSSNRSQPILQFQLRWDGGTAIRLSAEDTLGQKYFSPLQSLSGWTFVEAEWFAGDAPSTGLVRFRVHGILVYEETGIDFGDRRIDEVTLGAFGGGSNAPTGTLYFDDFVAAR